MTPEFRTLPKYQRDERLYLGCACTITDPV
jgi:hypothetical protein